MPQIGHDSPLPPSRKFWLHAAAKASEGFASSKINPAMRCRQVSYLVFFQPAPFGQSFQADQHWIPGKAEMANKENCPVRRRERQHLPKSQNRSGPKVRKCISFRTRSPRPPSEGSERWMQQYSGRSLGQHSSLYAALAAGFGQVVHFCL